MAPTGWFIMTAICVLLSTGCSSSSLGSRSSDPPAKIGPLGGSFSALPGSYGGICWQPKPGTVLSAGMASPTNHSSSSVTLTGAWLTGLKDMTVDAVYADVLQPGEGAVGDENGYPVASLRHPLAGTRVPAHATVEILFTVTAGQHPLATGEKITYTRGGQTYIVPNQWFLGMAPGAHC
jgi:hypothetical protein